MTLPHGWTSRRFDQLGELCSGSTPSSSRTEFWDGATVWVTPTDLSRLNTPYLHDSTKHITEGGLRNCSARLLPPGSIVLSSRAPIGYVAIPTVPFCTNQGCKSIALHNSYHSEFVYHAVTAAVPRLKRLGEGTTFAEISKSSLAKAEVVLPIDKAEQAKIAEVLSTVDRAIEQTEALIAKQQRIKTGLMQDLLTRGIDEHGDLRSEQTHEFKNSPLGRIPVEWDAKTVAELRTKGVIADVQDGNHGEKHPKSRDFVDEGIPFIMASDISRGTVDCDNAAKITDVQYSTLRVGFAKPNDVLLSHKASIGFVALVSEQNARLMLTPQVTYYRIAGKDRLLPRFLAQFFRSETWQIPLKVLARQSTRDYVGILAQQTLHVLIPKDSAEQERILNVLGAQDAGIRDVTSALGKLRSLKAGLMQDLLTGNRRVTPLLEQGEGTTA